MKRHDIILITLFAAACDPMDRVAVVNPPKGPEHVGLLVDGWRNGKHVVDEGYVPKLPPQGVPNLDGVGEVIAFGHRRAVAVEPVQWTPAPEDRVEVTMDAAYSLPITVWLVAGDPAEQEERMQDAIIQTNQIWDAERAGVRIGGMKFLDCREAATAELVDFDCSERKALSKAVGRDPKRINVYLLDRVDGQLARVTVCGGDGFAALAEGVHANDVTFALTANFGLEDIQQYGPEYVFDEHNVMHPAHGPRQYLSEGQVFRMHVDPHSVLNSIYQVRAGQLVRDCFGPEGTVGCLRLDRRLWADGVLGGE